LIDWLVDLQLIYYLAAFTVVEAYTVGVLVTFFDKLVVVQVELRGVYFLQ